jgi:hypothetical protein
MGIASLVTLRLYLHLAPLSVALSIGGLAAIVLALFLRRWLDAGAGGERGGFTAEALFEDETRQRMAEAAVGVAQMTPPRPEPSLSGGGRSGGAGATGSF